MIRKAGTYLMKNEKRLSDCCETAEQLQFYLEQKAQSHNSYKCYSRIERIQAIVKEIMALKVESYSSDGAV